jgi:hypothetical protein
LPDSRQALDVRGPQTRIAVAAAVRVGAVVVGADSDFQLSAISYSLETSRCTQLERT